ncbi:MAG: two-component sensor histidine kinase, partial [Burkholderiales bacterium]
MGGAVIALAGATAIARQSLEQQRALFETDARIVHRLLSQQVVQHDAILATLALLQPAPDAPAALGRGSPEQRLPALYPRILSVQRSDATTPWPDPGLAEAERLSRQSGRAALAPQDLSSGRYRLVLASEPASYALTIDLQALVPWAEWPMAPQTSAVRVELVHAGQRHLVQPGRLQAGAGSRFEFHKVVAAESQPFDVVATQTVGWRQWPWARMVAWVLAVVALLAALRHLQRQRLARRRAEELLRLGQVARLNT